MTWAHYFLQVNIYLVIFYAFYKLLLDKETYFVLNRMYLIAAGGLSLIIPFLRPEWFVRQPATQQIKISIDQLTMIAQGTVAPDESNPFSLIQALIVLYILGILFFLGRFIFQLFAVKKLFRANPAGMAFSFLGRKVIDPALPGLDTIERHEEIHIRQHHTFDVLFFELLGVLVWCNPIIYFYKTTIKNIHEYLADEEAAKFQGDKETYAMLILSQAFGVNQNILTNSFFNQSLIKKRVFMLYKKRSAKTAVLKYGLFLPLFAVTLLLSSATINKNESLRKVAEEISVPISLPEPSLPIIKAGPVKKETGSWAPFYAYLAKSIKYPVAAYKDQLQGNVTIKFTLQNNEPKNVGTVTQLGSGCDAEVMKTILNFNGFKSTENGQYSITIAFRMNGATTPLKNTQNINLKGYKPLRLITIISNYDSKTQPQDTEAKVYDFVSIDTQPGFPGGMDHFYAYLHKAVRYPAEAVKNNIQGKVFLSFIVEKTGELKDIKVERKLGWGTDEEAVRLLSSSPKWTPGTQDGVPVRVKYNIPISFTLTQENKTSAIPIETGAAPLYIIDGKPATDKTALEKISPNDIESMTVIKSEKAIVLYGDAGKNGAIQVVTKKKN
ncbi:TonB family protein [Pedobacter sp. PAMC26386]|nr:TonB family protein [Pedobacter sp. PAMC26386]